MTPGLTAALGVALLTAIAVLAVLVVWVGRDAARYRTLVLTATGLTFCLVVVGAYVRLSDAGLGCPDWPGCYGQAGVPDKPAAGSHAEPLLAPGAVAKGWKEMGHRYLASIDGALIVAVALVAWRARRSLRQSPALPLAIIAVIAVQAALGRWTVTLLLKPAIVSLHLAGGMTTFGLLVWLAHRQVDKRAQVRGIGPRAARWRSFAAGALFLVAAQILLGGWVSSNYAALACPDFPSCQGAWVPAMDFSQAFQVTRSLGRAADGGLLPLTALTAIHWVHRVWASLVVVYCSLLGFGLLRRRDSVWLGVMLLAAVWGQALLGIANVLLVLPLPLAAAHNAGAALLLAAVIVINFRLAAVPSVLPVERRTAHAISPGAARGS